MIAVPRSQLRRIVAVARLMASKSDLRFARAVIESDGESVCLRIETLTHAVQLRLPGAAPPGQLAAPYEAFTDAEGPNESPVFFEHNLATIIRTRWNERGIDQFHNYEVGTLKGPRDFETPAAFASLGESGRKMRAFADASSCASRDRGRYALDCIAFRGKTGDVAGTDGKHLLRVRGFQFPWNDVVLVPAGRIFTSKEFVAAIDLLVGRTSRHVVFAVGPWTLWLPIQEDARFPDVDAVLKDSVPPDSCCELSPHDAQFLADSLALLPGMDEEHHPVQIRFDGDVRVQGRAADGGQATELVLAGSAANGEPITFQTDRQYLQRALRMGVRSLKAWKTNTPIIAVGDERAYAWQPLTREPLAAANDVVRVSSQAAESSNVQVTPLPITSTKGTVMAQESKTPEPALESAPESHEVPKDPLQALIDDAEGLKQSIREASSKLSELIAGLRQHRKQAKLVQSTLASLRQLQHVA